MRLFEDDDVIAFEAAIHIVVARLIRFDELFSRVGARKIDELYASEPRKRVRGKRR